MIFKILRVFALLFVVPVIVNFSGCFYSFTGASVPTYMHSIAVPVFEDRSGSAEVGLSESMTSSLTRKFIDDNTLQVAGRANADAVVENSILSFTDVPDVISSGEQITRKRITITVRTVFRDLVQKKVVFDRQFSNYADYSVTEGNIFTNRQDAVNSAVDRVTDDILIGTVSNW